MVLFLAARCFSSQASSWKRLEKFSATLSRDRSDTDCVRAALFFAVELLPLALLYVGLIPKKKKSGKVAVVPIFLGSRCRHVSSSDMGRKKRGIAVHNWEKLVKSLRNILCSSIWTSFLLIFHLHAHMLSKFLPSLRLACDFSSCFLGLLAVACSKIQLCAWGFIRKWVEIQEKLIRGEERTHCVGELGRLRDGTGAFSEFH